MSCQRSQSVQLLGDERVVLRDERPRPLLEGRAVLLGPPVGELPVAVEARALVVEAVPDLVPDDRADRTVVRGRIAFCREERRLQDRGREHDLVEPGVVVRVHRLRRHEPFVAVDRMP